MRSFVAVSLAIVAATLVFLLRLNPNRVELNYAGRRDRYGQGRFNIPVENVGGGWEVTELPDLDENEEVKTTQSRLKVFLPVLSICPFGFHCGLYSHVREGEHVLSLWADVPFLWSPHRTFTSPCSRQRRRTRSRPFPTARRPRRIMPASTGHTPHISCRMRSAPFPLLHPPALILLLKSGRVQSPVHRGEGGSSHTPEPRAGSVWALRWNA